MQTTSSQSEAYNSTRTVHERFTQIGKKSRFIVPFCLMADMSSMRDLVDTILHIACCIVDLQPPCKLRHIRGRKLIALRINLFGCFYDKSI